MKALLVSAIALTLVGCPVNSGNSPTVNEPEKASWDYSSFMQREEDKAGNIEVQHILIGVKGNPRMPQVTRSEADARTMALEIYARAQSGEDFDKLVTEYTDDSPPGVYPMDQQSRKKMVPAFGDVGWRLKVGEIGMSDFDPVASPFGFHIIKRLK